MTWHGGPARHKTWPNCGQTVPTVPRAPLTDHRIALLSELLLENTAIAMDKAEILQAADSESPVTASPRLAAYLGLPIFINTKTPKLTTACNPGTRCFPWPHLGFDASPPQVRTLHRQNKVGERSISGVYSQDRPLSVR